MGFLFKENLHGLKCSMPGCDHKAEYLVSKCHPSAGVAVEFNELGVLTLRCDECNKYVIQVPTAMDVSSMHSYEVATWRIWHDIHPESALEASIDIRRGIITLACLECKAPIVKSHVLTQTEWQIVSRQENDDEEEAGSGLEIPLLVEVNDGGVYIYDNNGEEIVCWVKSEWEEDPTIVPAIINAVNIVLTLGPDELRKMIGRGSDGSTAEDQNEAF